jgi:hypothetical protein
MRTLESAAREAGLCREDVRRESTIDGYRARYVFGRTAYARRRALDLMRAEIGRRSPAALDVFGASDTPPPAAAA